MTFIDWSDAEEMLDLLTEFVRDAKAECSGDLARHRFLSQLLDQLMNLSLQLPKLSRDQSLRGLRAIYDSIDEEFKGDPVTSHIEDCVIELDRLP